MAFANSAGGVLVVGVDDDGRSVYGVSDPLDEEERLCSMIADGIEPRLVPNVELIPCAGRTLLAVEIYPSGSRPHWLKSEGAEGIYVRLGSTNRRADRALAEELRRNAAGTGFDEAPFESLEESALDLDGANTVFQGVRELDEHALLTLRLLVRSQERLVPSVGGVLLFGRNRAMHFPDAWIQCGRFDGKTKNVILDHLEIHDHLPNTVERAMEFTRKHSLRGADLSGVRRKDVWSIPQGILREAIINAVVHADYSQAGSPLRLAIYDDRVEVDNPGMLLPGLTLDDVQQGVSKLRNRVIGRVFRELGLIEQWGSGVRRMFDEAKALGLPAPEIIEGAMGIRVIVRLAAPLRTPQVAPQVAPQVKKLISRHRGERSRSELMRLLGLSDRMHFSRDYLQPALNAGLIEMTVPDKPNSRMQKYRLTDLGRAAAVGTPRPTH